MDAEYVIREAMPDDVNEVRRLETIAFGDPDRFVSETPGAGLGGVEWHKIVEDPQNNSAVIATSKVYGLSVTSGDRGVRSLNGGGDIAFSPCHQGRGTFRRLFEELLDDARKEDVHYFGGVPSQARIYGRFELAPVASFNRWEFDPAELKTVLAPSHPLRLQEVMYDSCQALLEERFRAFARISPGSVHRPRDWWLVPNLMYGRFSVARDDRLFAVVGARSFMTFIQRRGRIEVLDFCASHTDDVIELMSYLGRLQLADKIVLRLPCNFRPELLLDNPSAGELTGRFNSLWLRPISTGRILRERTWKCDGSFVIEVTDMVGISDGRWRVEVGSGDVLVCETTAKPDLVLPASRLAQLDMGFCSIKDLVDNGLAVDNERDVTRLIDAMFGDSGSPYSISSY